MSQHYDIVKDCLRGERKAQRELYNLYSRAMYNTCLRMLGTVENAEDVLQNAFIDVYTNLENFRFESSVGTWIKRIVVNNCINFMNKKRPNFTELTDNIPDMYSDVNYSNDQHESKWSVEHIKNAVQSLPEGYRVVFSLYAFEGYDHEEIADILKISESTSKSQYSRAKSKIRNLLN